MIFQKTGNLISNFISRFFRKKNNNQSGRFTEEKWKEDFSVPNKSRFSNEVSEKYSTEIIPGAGLLFKIKSENVFAWCQPPDFNYSDFDAECSFVFKSDNAYCSGGIIFRRGNDYNYYYFLVSSKGYFRVDCVFNGNPIKLIEWTSIAFPLESVNTLRVTAWDSYFLFFINNVQVARLSDETISSGSITFCAQNYDTAPVAELLLKNISINSIPDEVGEIYSENRDIPLSQKLVLAKSFFGKGQFLPAAVQMKSYLESINKEDIIDEFLGFYGEILLNLGMYNDALIQFNEALEKKPVEKNYILEKANILYQLGNYNDLKIFLLDFEDLLKDSAIYWNLRGHSMFYLGNSETAAEYYKKATEFDAENPLYFLNLAKAYEALEDNEKAASCYAEASLLFFRQNNYAEAEDAASIALKKETDNWEIIVKAESVIAKILFAERKYLKAEKEFERLIKTAPDLCGSEIFFLYGLLKLNQGKTDEAVSLIEKACEKEEYYLYWYKLAEIFHSTGRNPEKALSKAYKLAPDDIWVNNLLGEMALEKGDSITAEKYFEKSFSIAKNNQEIIPALNYSEALIINNKEEEALKVLNTVPQGQEKEILIQKGRIYELIGRLEEAEKIYKKALAVYRNDKDVIKALVSFYYNLEQYGKAEEILAGINNLESDSEFLNMIGNLARIAGNFDAAFDAYKKSLALKYDPVVALNYVEGLCEALNFREAKIKLDHYFGSSKKSNTANGKKYLDKSIAESDKISGADNVKYDNRKILQDKSGKLQKRMERLSERIYRETSAILSCCSCGREWEVPKDVDADKKLKLVGDPDPNSPAGKCSSCGKIYCVKCASKWLEDGRFKCPDCKENLKLSDKYLRHLALKSASDSQA